MTGKVFQADLATRVNLYGSQTVGGVKTFTGHTVLRNATVKTVDGASDRLRVLDDMLYTPGPVQVGTDLGSTSDPYHRVYVHADTSVTPTLVDTFLVEVNGRTTGDSDLGAVAGFARAMAATGIVSLRGVAGQLTVDFGAQPADREAGEFGVHNALLITSKADNRTAFTKAFGASGLLISAYSGIMIDGNPAQRANSAVVINTFSGLGGHWKQFLVAYDGLSVKSWQVDGDGNQVVKGTYGFVDSNGDVDAGTDMQWISDDILAWRINTTEMLRLSANGLGIGTAPIAGHRLKTSGGSIQMFSGAAGTSLPIEFGRTAIDAILAIVGSATEYAAASAQSDLVLRSEASKIHILSGGGNDSIRVGVSAGAPTLGLFGVADVVRPSAFTQTYATATKTHANPTSAILTVSVGTPSTTIPDVGAAFSQTTLNNIVRSLADQINALRVDEINTKDVLNSVIDDGQSVGFFQ